MPFDSVFKPFDRNATVENLRKAKGMISNPKNWCQGAWSKTVAAHTTTGTPWLVERGHILQNPEWTHVRLSCTADAVHCAVYGMSVDQATDGLTGADVEARLKLFGLRPEMQALQHCLSIKTGHPYAVSAITAYNDYRDTTHADVMELFDRAIAYAREVHHAV